MLSTCALTVTDTRKLASFSRPGGNPRKPDEDADPADFACAESTA